MTATAGTIMVVDDEYDLLGVFSQISAESRFSDKALSN
jgi:hypothetical protein